jgi:hypothetical protein
MGLLQMRRLVVVAGPEKNTGFLGARPQKIDKNLVDEH